MSKSLSNPSATATLGPWILAGLDMGAVLNVSRDHTRFQASIIWPQIPNTEAIEAGGSSVAEALKQLDLLCQEDAGEEMRQNGGA